MLSPVARDTSSPIRNTSDPPSKDAAQIKETSIPRIMPHPPLSPRAVADIAVPIRVGGVPTVGRGAFVCDL